MLYFTNPGEIDIRGATIAGLSAKDTNTPIGKFGTGLKYAIASILRWGGDITIHAGPTHYQFTALDLDFRGAAFKQVAMNICPSDQAGSEAPSSQTPLGFTTEYGKHWEPWEIFRELLANARDEGGDVSDTAPNHIGQPGYTTIVVNCPQLTLSYNERHTIILPSNTTYAYTTSAISIGETSAQHIYYRGVRVQAEPCALTYNILENMELTEDRTLRWSWQAGTHIARALQSCTVPAIIRAALTASTIKNSFESDLTFSEGGYTTPEFLDVAAQLYKIDPRIYAKLAPILRQHRPETLIAVATPLSKVQQAMLDKAIGFVARMGVDPHAVSITVTDLGPTTLSQYNRKQDHVYLSPELFKLGTKQLVSTLYEELIHRETGKSDCNYDMQTYLFNIIVSLHEEHVFGEPI